MRNVAQVIRNRANGSADSGDILNVVSNGFDAYDELAPRNSNLWPTAQEIARELLTLNSDLRAIPVIKEQDVRYFSSCDNRPNVDRVDKTYVHAEFTNGQPGSGGRAQYYYVSLPEAGCIY